MSNQIQGIQSTQSQSSQEDAASGVVSLSDVREAVNELNNKIDSQAVRVNFDVDEETGRIVVQVKDVETGDVLRQIPSEEMLDFARNASKGVGVTLDTQL